MRRKKTICLFHKVGSKLILCGRETEKLTSSYYVGVGLKR